MTIGEIEKLAYEYIFKRFAVANSVTEAVEKAYRDGAHEANIRANKEHNLLLIQHREEVYRFNKLIEKNARQSEAYADEKRAEIEELEFENKKMFNALEQVKDIMIPGAFDIFKCQQILSDVLYPGASAKTEA